jgi:hypothetical protein
MIYNRKPKETAKKSLELISEFSNVVGHKMNTQNPLYLCTLAATRNWNLKTPFTIGSKYIEIFRD